jgi:hypothetical protein
VDLLSNESDGRYVTRQRPCLFQLFRASGHQKLLRTAKRLAFQSASIKFVWVKTIQNQHKHIIGWVVAIVGIRHFLDPESYGHLYLPPHVILMILRFSIQPDSPHSQILRKDGQKKAEPNRPNRSRCACRYFGICTVHVYKMRTQFLLHAVIWEEQSSVTVTAALQSLHLLIKMLITVVTTLLLAASLYCQYILSKTLYVFVPLYNLPV